LTRPANEKENRRRFARAAAAALRKRIFLKKEKT
jgi:hypothetical protein